MTSQEITQAVETGITNAMAKPHDEFHVPREKHYKHHEFIDAFITLVKDGKTTIFKTLVRAATLGVIGLIMGGVIYWYTTKGGG